jgi:predicted ArsR family transcriptional regulator
VPAAPLTETARVLAEQGYEPRVEGTSVVLANCPFHALARTHTELVCGMNLRLLCGVLDGVPSTGLAADLQPEPGRCCVRIAPDTPDQGTRASGR